MQIRSEENRECVIGILFEFTMALHILVCVGLIFHFVFFFLIFFLWICVFGFSFNFFSFWFCLFFFWFVGANHVCIDQMTFG